MYVKCFAFIFSKKKNSRFFFVIVDSYPKHIYIHTLEIFPPEHYDRKELPFLFQETERMLQTPWGIALFSQETLAANGVPA